MKWKVTIMAKHRSGFSEGLTTSVEADTLAEAEVLAKKLEIPNHYSGGTILSVTRGDEDDWTCKATE